MTTSSPAATQMRARLSPDMHPKVFLNQMPFMLQHSLFWGFETGSEYAGLHTLRLGTDWWLTNPFCKGDTRVWIADSGNVKHSI